MTRPDQFALELHQPAEHGQHEPVKNLKFLRFVGDTTFMIALLSSAQMYCHTPTHRIEIEILRGL